jgi:hypothetical protein
MAMRWLVLAFFVGCGDGPATVGDPIDDPQVPPRGHEDLLAWLEAGFYESWACEPEAVAGRTPAHGERNRICTNDALAAAPVGEGPYPVGAAAVKEVVDDAGNIRIHAVYRKVDAAAGGDSWYWFEGNRGNIVANGEGDSTCTGCHSSAPRDFVFTVVQ